MKIILLSALVLFFVANAVSAQAQSAEKRYRNIQVWNGVPARNVNSIMRAFNRALGVECTACHV